MKSILLLCLVVVTKVVVGAPCSDCDDAPPVNILTYYEAMCPFSRKFIVQQLYPTFSRLPDSVINVTVVPWGFAHEKVVNGEYTIYNCQHGPMECEGNKMHACALHLTGYDPRAYMPFINCMMITTAHMHPLQALNKCAPETKLDRTAILDCYGSKLGGELTHQMKLTTNAAHIHYVPWIVVDGEHDKRNVVQHDGYYHLLEVVCQRYNGTEPDACKRRTHETLIG